MVVGQQKNQPNKRRTVYSVRLFVCPLAGCILLDVCYNERKNGGVFMSDLKPWKPERGAVITYESGESVRHAVVEAALTKEETKEVGMFGQLVHGLDLETGNEVHDHYTWDVCEDVTAEMQQKAQEQLDAYDKRQARIASAESLMPPESDGGSFDFELG